MQATPKTNRPAFDLFIICNHRSPLQKEDAQLEQKSQSSKSCLVALLQADWPAGIFQNLSNTSSHNKRTSFFYKQRPEEVQITQIFTYTGTQKKNVWIQSRPRAKTLINYWELYIVILS